MKQLTLITALFLLAATGASAQSTAEETHKRDTRNYPVRFGIKAGPGISNMTVNNTGNVHDKRAIPAWHAGMYLDLPVLPALFVQPGLVLGSKGSRFTVGDNESSNYTEVSTRPIYIEVPVNVVVKIPLPNKVKLFAGAGPYLAAGIGGKNKLEGKLLGIGFSDNKRIEYNTDNNGSAYNSDLKRFDGGFNFLAGLEISHFTLNANYGYGLTNIKSGSNGNDSKYANRVTSVSVGLLF